MTSAFTTEGIADKNNDKEIIIEKKFLNSFNFFIIHSVSHNKINPYINFILFYLLINKMLERFYFFVYFKQNGKYFLLHFTVV